MKEARFLIKETLGFLVRLLGGVYILRVILKKQHRLVILNYHNFSKYNNYKIRRGSILETNYAKNFEKQISFLKKNFKFCYPEEFFEGKCETGVNLLITFDDGYKDNYDIAFPILKKHGIPTIFFVATNYIDGENWLWHDKARYLATKGIVPIGEVESYLRKMNRGYAVDKEFIMKVEDSFSGKLPKRIMMQWQEVGQLLDNGFKVGSHTFSHAIMSSLSEEEQEKEVFDSINEIKLNTSISCEHFAFPNGLYNSTTLQLLQNNVEFGYTTNRGFNHCGTNRLELKRIGVNASDSLSVLVLKLILNIRK